MSGPEQKAEQLSEVERMRCRRTNFWHSWWKTCCSPNCRNPTGNRGRTMAQLETRQGRLRNFLKCDHFVTRIAGKSIHFDDCRFSSAAGVPPRGLFMPCHYHPRRSDARTEGALWRHAQRNRRQFQCLKGGAVRWRPDGPAEPVLQ